MEGRRLPKLKNSKETVAQDTLQKKVVGNI